MSTSTLAAREPHGLTYETWIVLEFCDAGGPSWTLALGCRLSNKSERLQSS